MTLSDEQIRKVTREVLAGIAAQRPSAMQSPEPTEPASRRGNCRIELVVFDLAGTTIRDDDATVLECFLAAAREVGIAATADELNAWMGAAKKQVFQHFSRRMGGEVAHVEERAERGYLAFQRFLEHRYRTGAVEPIPGIEECFETLHRHGVRTAASTGFYRKVVDILFERLGWNSGLIDVSIASDEVPRGRPAPYMIFSAMTKLGIESVERVVKIGDTPLDIREGRNAGVAVNIGVLSGSHDARSLGRSGHAYLLPSAAELPELLANEGLL